MYNWHRGFPLYEPDKKPDEEYHGQDTNAINHFYEKLLLLKDRMNTKTGRKLAEQRHKFMEIYLEEFFKEWDGKG